MAKAKEAVKMSKEESKELVIKAAPVVPLKFDTNIAELKKELKKNLSKYVGMKVSDSNFEQCKLVQKQCVTTRTLLESKLKETIKMYIDLPKDTLKAQFQELLSMVANVEDGIKEQMDVFDEERKTELTQVFKLYIAEFQKKYNLPQKYMDQITLLKCYYNKTAKESDTRADIERQFQDQEAEHQNRIDDEALIRNTVGDNKMLSADTWIAQLEYRSASAIVMDIQNEKTRLEELVDKPETVVGTITIGAASPSLSGTLKRDTKKKTMKIEITYPAYQGADIKAFFDSHPDIQVRTWK